MLPIFVEGLSRHLTCVVASNSELALEYRSRARRTSFQCELVKALVVSIISEALIRLTLSLDVSKWCRDLGRSHRTNPCGVYRLWC